MKRIILLSCFMIVTAMTWAQGPNHTGEYYKAADGKKGAALKTALFNILRYEHTFLDEEGETQTKKFTAVPYSGLLEAYEDTDLDSDNKIWDMYSIYKKYTINNSVSSYKKEGDGWNREHSVPQSWFKEATPMKSDLFHVYPTDAAINGMRSSFPYGKVGTITQSSWGPDDEHPFSKLGWSTDDLGYSGKVFEPNDLYKGDLARSYFYMVTCYEGENFTYGSKPGGGAVFESGDKMKYPAMKTWALNLFLEWSHNDEIGPKEYNRNNAVYGLQFNRNPYIDYPGLEQYIWGSMTDVAFSYDNYQVPENYSIYIPGDDPGPVDPPGPSGDGNVYKRVKSINDLEVGACYIIVCESRNMAMSEQGSNIRSNVSLTTTNGAVTTEVNKSGKPYELTLGTSNGNYTLYDATGKVYLAHSSGNSISTSNSAPASATGSQWTISFSGNNAVITNAKNTDYSIKYNTSSPRFACYKSTSNMTAIQLYKRQPVSTSVTTEAAFPIDKAKPNTIIYDLQGRKVGTTVNGTPHLKKGVYIMSGRKVIAK